MMSTFGRSGTGVKVQTSALSFSAVDPAYGAACAKRQEEKRRTVRRGDRYFR
jgi:hypothetical protein